MEDRIFSCIISAVNFSYMWDILIRRTLQYKKKYHLSKIVIPNEHNVCCIVLIYIVDTIISFCIGFISSISHTS